MKEKKIKNNEIGLVFLRIGKIQFFTLFFLSVFFYLSNEKNIAYSLITCGIASFLYAFLFALSSLNPSLVLLGFPFRITLIGIPIAILVHKFHFNLIALFIGFVISQIIYIVGIFKNIKTEMEKQ